MPASASENQLPIIKEILRHKGNISILDIGIGWGNFGKLIKDQMPQAKIIGVEVWPKYNNYQWDYYDQVIIQDIRQCLTSLRYFDIILAIDVIEHFPKDEGAGLIKQLRAKTNNLLVSVPIIDYPQGPYAGNPYEIHRAQWKPQEMLTLGAKWLYHGQIIGLFRFNGKLSAKVKQLIRRYF
ncbi:MAG: class I SAM-dependent methyltransferase [Nanoarchaeota archaeon]|nr:class I SAM-dependent methyltransferase [Nanoarchaeota archaeon]